MIPAVLYVCTCAISSLPGQYQSGADFGNPSLQTFKPSHVLPLLLFKFMVIIIIIMCLNMQVKSAMSVLCCLHIYNFRDDQLVLEINLGRNSWS